MQDKIVPNLWFNGNAREAVEFYISVFPKSKIISTRYYPEEGLLDFQKSLAGKELMINFELNGNEFTAINAGPEFTFTEAISFVVTCIDQDEIDYYWSKFSTVPEAEQCGWCKDQYGLSWQIVPKNISQLVSRSGSFAHMMKMKKNNHHRLLECLLTTTQKIKRILDAEKDKCFVYRIDKPTTAKSFKGEVRHFDHYYRIYDIGHNPIPYCKFQQIDLFANIMNINVEDIVIHKSH